VLEKVFLVCLNDSVSSRSIKMETKSTIDLLNEVGLLKNVKPYVKMNTLPIGKPFNVIKFAHAGSKYGNGKTLIVELDEVMINLPNRFNVIYDTEEKIADLNSTSFKLIYNGTPGKTPLIRFERGDDQKQHQ